MLVVDEREDTPGNVSQEVPRSWAGGPRGSAWGSVVLVQQGSRQNIYTLLPYLLYLQKLHFHYSSPFRGSISLS